MKTLTANSSSNNRQEFHQEQQRPNTDMEAQIALANANILHESETISSSLLMQMLAKNDSKTTFREKFQIPALQYVEMEEAKYYFPASGEDPEQVDLKDKNLYYGAFYAKLVTTLNKIKQYNHMVYGDPKGVIHRRAELQGVPNKVLRARLDEAIKLSGMSQNSLEQANQATINHICMSGIEAKLRKKQQSMISGQTVTFGGANMNDSERKLSVEGPHGVLELFGQCSDKKSERGMLMIESDPNESGEMEEGLGNQEDDGRKKLRFTGNSFFTKRYLSNRIRRNFIQDNKTLAFTKRNNSMLPGKISDQQHLAPSQQRSPAPQVFLSAARKESVDALHLGYSAIERVQGDVPKKFLTMEKVKKDIEQAKSRIVGPQEMIDLLFPKNILDRSIAGNSEQPIFVPEESSIRPLTTKV
jgi:hypothetical protein